MYKYLLRQRLKKGFTIVELVIVIAVIAILSAVLIPTFVNLAKSANTASDVALVRNINTLMAMDEAVNGKSVTMHQALQVAEKGGYIVDRITPTSGGNDIVWDSTTNRFALLKENSTTVVYADKDSVSSEKVNLWKIYSAVPAEQSYSVYLKGTDVTGDVGTLTVGFDAGANTAITAVSYVRNDASTPPQSVVIRTNSFSTNLTIDASQDSVDLYGNAGKVFVKKVADASLHIHNEVVYVELGQGHLVVEPNARIEIINKTSGTSIVDNKGGAIGYAHAANKESAVNSGSVTFEYEPSAVNIEEQADLAVGEKTGNIDENKYNAYVATVNRVGYDSLQAAIEAANDGDTVSLLKDIDDATSNKTVSYTTGSVNTKTVAFMIEKSITINGFNHKILTKCNVGLAINKSNVKVALNNLDFTTTSMSVVYVGEGISGVDLSICNSLLTASNSGGYTIKTCNGSNNMKLSIDNSSLLGWAAINFRSSNSSILVTNSNLSGENNASEGSSNNYASFVIDGDSFKGFPHADQPGVCGSNNTISVKNTKISATSSSTNTQTWLSIQYGAKNNNVTVTIDCKITNADNWSYTEEENGTTNTVIVGGTKLIGQK